MKKLFRKLIIAVLVIAAVAAFRLGSVLRDRPEPVCGYAVFFADTGKFLNCYGEEEEIDEEETDEDEEEEDRDFDAEIDAILAEIGG